MESALQLREQIIYERCGTTSNVALMTWRGRFHRYMVLWRSLWKLYVKLLMEEF